MSCSAWPIPKSQNRIGEIRCIRWTLASSNEGVQIHVIREIEGQGNNVVIRMVGLNFDSGKSVISSQYGVHCRRGRNDTLRNLSVQVFQVVYALQTNAKEDFKTH